MIHPLILAVTIAGLRPVQGQVILARTGSSALYIWDATPYVAQLVADGDLGSDGMRALEATALRALADRAKGSSADSVALRVVFQKSGAVSPVYGTATFEGMEEVMTLKAERKPLLAAATAWIEDLLHGKPASGLAIDVTGKLPPP